MLWTFFYQCFLLFQCFTEFCSKHCRIMESIEIYAMLCGIWYHLHSLKNVKNTHAGVLLLVWIKVTLLHGCFSHFLNCTNGTKWRKASLKKRILERNGLNLNSFQKMKGTDIFDRPNLSKLPILIIKFTAFYVYITQWYIYLFLD